MMGLVARLVGLKSCYYTSDSFPYLPYRNVKKQAQKLELDFLHQLNTWIPVRHGCVLVYYIHL